MIGFNVDESCIRWPGRFALWVWSPSFFLASWFLLSPCSCHCSWGWFESPWGSSHTAAVLLLMRSPGSALLAVAVWCGSLIDGPLGIGCLCIGWSYLCSTSLWQLWSASAWRSIFLCITSGLPMQTLKGMATSSWASAAMVISLLLELLQLYGPADLLGKFCRTVFLDKEGWSGVSGHITGT